MARFCRSFQVYPGFPSSNGANRKLQSDEFSVGVYSRSSSKKAVDQRENEHESDNNNSDKGEESSPKEALDQDENKNESDNDSDEGDGKKSEELGDSWSFCEPAEFSFESLLEGTSDSNTRPYSTAQQNSYHISCTNDGLRLCTESLGFESSDEREHCGSSYVEFDNKKDENDYRRESDGGGAATRGGGIGIRSAPVQAGSKKEGPGPGPGAACFPPPLSSMGPDGQPLVFLKPLRKDGRFLLQEVKLPRHELLQAWRQDGRLRLQVVPSPSPPRDAVVGEADECAQGSDKCTSSTGEGQKWVASLEEEGVHVDCFGMGAAADASLAQYQEAVGMRCHHKSKCMTSTWKPRCITTRCVDQALIHLDGGFRGNYRSSLCVNKF